MFKPASSPAHQPYTRSLSSIVKEIEEANTIEAQVALLQKHSSKELKAIIGFAMSPNVKWMLPVGAPPFKFSQELDNEGRFYSETGKLIHFVDSPDGGRRLTNVKREKLFMDMLEVVHPEDARLLLRIKDRQVRIRQEAVRQAFPNLTKDWK
jgi:hypothetical protein